MREKILFVDDDVKLLAAVERNLRQHFNLETVTGGAAALAKMADAGPYAVVVADMQMPGMNGVDLLIEAQKKFPETVRLMLTGNADQQTAVEAVNKGHVFQFLNKPCPPEMIARALNAGIKQHLLITAERVLLEKTLNGSVKILADVLSLTDPFAFGRGEALAGYMNAYISSFNFDRAWEFQIAAMLAQVGLITVPPAIIEKSRAGESLSAAEQDTLNRVPKISADLVANIPRLESAARIVLYQNKHYDGSGFPADAVHGEDIPIGARILKVLIDLLELEAKKMPRDEALSIMQQRTGWYDPRVLDATFACFDIYLPDTSVKSQGQAVAVKDLRLGHVVLADVMTESGKTLILARSRITPVLLARLANFARFSPIQEPVYIEPDVTVDRFKQSLTSAMAAA
ncbi:MAG TPA: HD domain-containing phosphohydrolase [Verrucomicrobiae bacterium]|nr:HD domain-containing phosphohydrolase [Verrucomicrobiae bacterium]